MKDISNFLGVDTTNEILNAYKRRRTSQINEQKDLGKAFKDHAAKLDSFINECDKGTFTITKEKQVYLAELRKTLVEVSVVLHDSLNSFHRGNNIAPQFELFDKSNFDQNMKSLEKDLEIMISRTSNEVKEVKRKLYLLSQTFLRNNLFGDRVE